MQSKLNDNKGPDAISVLASLHIIQLCKGRYTMFFIWGTLGDIWGIKKNVDRRMTLNNKTVTSQIESVTVLL